MPTTLKAWQVNPPSAMRSDSARLRGEHGDRNTTRGNGECPAIENKQRHEKHPEYRSIEQGEDMRPQQRPDDALMQQGFHHLVAACNHQRQLLITVECLQQQLQEQEIGCSTQSDSLPEALLKQMVELSETIITHVDHLVGILLQDAAELGSSQLQQEIEGACHQLLDTTLSVAQAALAVIDRYGHARWASQALTLAATRNQDVQARLRGQRSAAARQAN